MKLFAISDLHVGYPGNRAALDRTPPHPDDWLILAGDVGETAEHLDHTLTVLTRRFARLVWVPGNHELWTRPVASGLRGTRKYAELLDVCRRHGTLTPEDPYGHLHLRRSDRIDGVRFEEVSLGYPGQWQDVGLGLEPYLRQILPATPESF